MKRLISLCAVLLLVLAPMAALADGESVNVTVTISVSPDNVPVKLENVEVTDSDSDGALTINDALWCAHEKLYDGGAAEGYAAAESQYGLGLAKLCGVANGGSYGYYLNNAAAFGLTDPVSEGAYLVAFVYSDTAAFSDAYTWLETDAESVEAGTEITLTLNAAGYDANWNPVVLPFEGATVTVDGELTEAVTDAEGKAKITLTEGEHEISAVCADKVIVPPFMKLSAAPAATQAPVTEAPASSEAPVATEPVATEAPSTTGRTAPVTGDFGGLALVVAGASVILAVGLKRKNAR